MITAKELIKVFAICSRLHNSAHTSISNDDTISVDIGDFVLWMKNKDWVLNHSSKITRDVKLMMHGSRTFQKHNCLFSASPFIKVTSVKFFDMNSKEIEMDIPSEMLLPDTYEFSKDSFDVVLDSAEMFEFFLNTHTDDHQETVLKAFLEFNFKHFKCIQAHVYPYIYSKNIDFSAILEHEELIYEA